MVLNADKTKQIRFSLNPTSRANLCLCDPIDISSVSELKLLGITFQRNFLFTKHVDNLLAHCRSLLYLLKDLRIHRASIHDSDRLFDAVILSKLRYGISVYGCDRRALQKVDSFLRKCHSKNFVSKVINIYQLLKNEDKRLLEKIMNSANHPLRAYLLTHSKARTTRHNFFAVKPRTMTKLFLHSFCNRILSL